MNPKDQEQHERFIVPEIQRERAERLARMEAELLGGVIGERLNRLEALVTGSRAGSIPDQCRSSPDHHGIDRLAFWKWKAAVIQRIFEHPAMQPDAEPVIVPDFDGWHWEDDFINGVTVDEMADRANAEFNRGGW